MPQKNISTMIRSWSSNQAKLGAICVCYKTIFIKAMGWLTFRTSITHRGGEEGEERDTKIKFWVLKWAYE